MTRPSPLLQGLPVPGGRPCACHPLDDAACPRCSTRQTLCPRWLPAWGQPPHAAPCAALLRWQRFSCGTTAALSLHGSPLPSTCLGPLGPHPSQAAPPATPDVQHTHLCCCASCNHPPAGQLADPWSHTPLPEAARPHHVKCQVARHTSAHLCCCALPPRLRFLAWPGAAAGPCPRPLPGLRRWTCSGDLSGC